MAIYYQLAGTPEYEIVAAIRASLGDASVVVREQGAGAAAWFRIRSDDIVTRLVKMHQRSGPELRRQVLRGIFSCSERRNVAITDLALRDLIDEWPGGRSYPAEAARVLGVVAIVRHDVIAALHARLGQAMQAEVRMHAALALIRLGVELGDACETLSTFLHSNDRLASFAAIGLIGAASDDRVLRERLGMALARASAAERWDLLGEVVGFGENSEVLRTLFACYCVLDKPPIHPGYRDRPPDGQGATHPVERAR